MNRTIASTAAIACALLGGCFRPQDNLHGQCKADGDCAAGSRCDTSQDPPICVSSTCSPPCTSSSVCDLQTVTCKPVTEPSVLVTSPSADGFIGASVQASATARA